MEQQSEKEWSDYLRMIRIEKTFLFASFPVIGYIITYLYQKHFLDFFDVPSWFIRVNIENIVANTTLVSLACVLVSIILFFLILLFSKFPKNKPQGYKEPTLLEYNSWAIALLLVLPAGLYFSLTINIYIKLTIMLSIMIFLSFIMYGLPYIYFPKETSFLETIKKYTKKEYEKKLQEQNDSKGNFNFLLLKVPYFGYTIYIILILGVLLVSALLGQNTASREEYFYILNQNEKTYILVGLYDGQLLTVSFNGEKRETTKEIKILPLNSLSDFSYQNTGRINQYKRNDDYRNNY